MMIICDYKVDEQWTKKEINCTSNLKELDEIFSKVITKNLKVICLHFNFNSDVDNDIIRLKDKHLKRIKDEMDS